MNTLHMPPRLCPMVVRRPWLQVATYTSLSLCVHGCAGQVLSGVIESFAEMAGGLSETDSRNDSTADNSPGALASASEMGGGVSGSHR
jgi:hypothetical protein